MKTTTTLPEYSGRQNIGKGIRWNVSGNQRTSDGPVLADFFEARINFETLEEAQNFAGQFAKYLKVRATTLSTYDSIGGMYETYQIGTAGMKISLRPDATTGAVNETGLKRIKNFMAACEQLGYTMTRERWYANSIDFDPKVGR
jgi:hypothetical protein